MKSIQLKHIAILLAFLGTIFLYFISTLTTPTPVTLDQIPDYEGAQVTVTGWVIEHHTTDYHTQLINIKDDTAILLQLYVEGNAPVEYGDTISATGTVEKYQGNWELVVDDPRHIDIIQTWNETRHPLWQLAENPDIYEGINVTIVGVVDQVYETFFYLRDASNQYFLVVIYDDHSNITVAPGEQVTVAGRFLYDMTHLRYSVQITSTDHGVIKRG